MIGYLNNPAVSLATRSWLATCTESGREVDAPCAALIQRIVDRCRKVHPGGLMYTLATELGVSHDPAMALGSAGELFYAGCSVTDDLQDGDTAAYLADVPIPVQLNSQLQLICLVALRLEQLEADVRIDVCGELVADVYKTLATMLTGQRMELTRDPWTPATYESVARLSAGEQFGTYFRIVASVARTEVEPWVEMGRAFGNMLQIIADHESNDERFTTFASQERDRLWSMFLGEVDEAAGQLGGLMDEHVAGLRRRCPSKSS